MTAVAEQEGLATPVCHAGGPFGLPWPGWGEVGERADVVHLHLLGYWQISQAAARSRVTSSSCG